VHFESCFVTFCGPIPQPAHGNDDANGTGGSVVNFERVGSNRKEMAMSGVLLVICIVPTGFFP
jgi:hypothetical protein